MQIHISPWVNTRTYYIDKISSISFIEDVSHQFFYILKGNLSDLWDVIVKTENFNIIYNMAVKIGFEKQLYSFLSELEKKNLIITDKKLQSQSVSYITFTVKKGIKNFILFEKIQSKIAYNNNLLSTLYLTLSYKCNLKCKHCCNPKNMDNHIINFKIAQKIIDEAYYDLGVNEICLTGGECTINKDFLKIAEYIRKKHLKLYIFTNGQKFYEDNTLFDKIVSIYPSIVQISLYSMNPDIHDNITRVKGSFLKTINVIKMFRERNINVRVSCFQMSYNFGEDKKVKEFAKSVGAEFLSGCMFMNNIENKNIQAKLSYKNIEEYYLNNIDIKNTRKKFEKAEEPICTAGIDKLCITPALYITPCIYFDYILGNYSYISLKDIKNNVLPEFLKTFLVKNLKDCYKYDYCEYCSYCPIYNYMETGNYMKKNKILCEDAKAYQKAIQILKRNKPAIAD